MRALLDLNVSVSALVNPTGTPAEAVRLGLGHVYEIVTSPRLLDELREVLERNAFRRYFSLDDAAEFVGALIGASELVGDPSDVDPLTRDPDDDYLVALARCASVDRLVTGDGDLTEFVGSPVPIVSPGEFVAELLGR